MIDIKKEQVAFSNKLVFTVGSIGKELVYGLTSATLFLYSLQVLHLEALYLIIIFLSCTLISSFFDPVIGYILDCIKSPSPFGKYKIMIFWGLIANVLCLCGFFLTSDTIPASTNKIYIAITYLLWSLTFCSIDIPLWAIIASFHTTTATRNTLSTIPCLSRHLGLQCALLLILNVFRDSEYLLNSSYESYVVTLIFNITLLILCISSFLILLKNYTNKGTKKNGYFKRLLNYFSPYASREYQELNNLDRPYYSKRRHPHPNFWYLKYRQLLKSYYKFNKKTKNFLNTRLPFLKLGQQKYTYSKNSMYHTDSPYNNTNSQEDLIKQEHINAIASSNQANYNLDSQKQNKNSNQAQSAYLTSSSGKTAEQEFYDHSSDQDNQEWKQLDAAQRYHLYPFNNTSTAPWYNTNINKHSIRDLYKIANYEELSSKIQPNLNKSYVNMIENSQLGSYKESHKPKNNNANLANLDDALPKEFKDQVYQNSYSNSLKSQMSVGKVLSFLFKNDQLLILFLTNLLASITFHISYGSTFFYCIEEHLFQHPQIYSIIILGSVMQLLSMICYPFLLKYFSVSKVFIGAILLFMIGSVSLLFIPESTSPFLFEYLTFNYTLISISIALSRIALVAMTADTVDYGEFKQSLRLDGVIFSLHTMTNRIGSALSLFVYGNAFFISHYSLQSLGMYTDHISAMINLKIAVCVIIVIIGIALLLYINYYKLNGAFYRNILNNIQYLRQNQKPFKNIKEEKNTQNFRLRYSLDSSTMIIKLKAKNEEEVLKAMIQKLAEVNAISSEYDYMCDLKARLKESNCGIAEGIAMPHAKSNAVRRATVVVATLDTPLDMGAYDNQDCDLIFLLASPDDGFTHLNMLGRLSLLLNEPGFADKLRASGSPTELFERLIQCEKHIIR